MHPSSNIKDDTTCPRHQINITSTAGAEEKFGGLTSEYSLSSLELETRMYFLVRKIVMTPRLMEVH